MADRIALHGIRAFGRHGVLPQERRDGQTFTVDVDLWCDTSKAAASDDLADTVDYAALARRVADVVEGEPVNLIETLAARVAEAVLAQSGVEEVDVTVHKPEAPVPVPFGDVAVSIRRRRS